ncbi:MAG: FixH family protein [Pseudomonadota bacterium]
MNREIRGIHVLGFFLLAFGTIIAVNLTLAFNAVSTFPGLEVKNSYVASQSFEDDRAAQLALNWRVSAMLEDGEVALTITRDGRPVLSKIEEAIFGRATSVAHDQNLSFIFRDGAHRATVAAGPGNWNLRLKARAANGVLFTQRIIVETVQ